MSHSTHSFECKIFQILNSLNLQDVLKTLCNDFETVMFYESAQDVDAERSSYSIMAAGERQTYKIDTPEELESFKVSLESIQIDLEGHDALLLKSEVSDIAKSLFGYLQYEAVEFFEGSVAKNKVKDGIDLPIAQFIIPEFIVIFETHGDNNYVFANSREGCDEFFSAYLGEETREQCEESYTRPAKSVPALYKNKLKISGEAFHSALTLDNFRNIVKKSIDYIKKGDAFQIVPSLRIVAPCDVSPISMYYNLRAINPSPFMVFVKINGTYIIGSSPEILVRLKSNEITVRPLAGTRKTAKSKYNNSLIARELLSDKKEVAEHLMLIDLARNDIGRVAEVNTVSVPRQMEIELYSHVMHMSSTVTGVRDFKYSSFDVLASSFPAGTTSGAPKIRSMQIISELEPHRRSIYSGCIGYLSKHRLETCIALRTCIISNGLIHIQAGCGVVSDSDPDKECDEVIIKMTALIKAFVATKKSIDTQ